MTQESHAPEETGIGAALRAARLGRNLELDDVSARLKIRADHLNALENEDFAALPGTAYVIGFIRAYGNHLDLNAADLVARYKLIGDDDAESALSFAEEEPSEPISGSLKLTFAVVAVLGVYVLWLATGGDPVPPPVEVVETPAAPPVEVAPVEIVEIPPQVEVEPPAIEPAPVVAAPVEVETPPIVRIRAIERTWMRLEDGTGRVLFSSIIASGKSFTLEAPGPYVLATRDAGALEYVVDDRVVGKVGRRGQILTGRAITRAAISRRGQ